MDINKVYRQTKLCLVIGIIILIVGCLVMFEVISMVKINKNSNNISIIYDTDK